MLADTEAGSMLAATGVQCSSLSHNKLRFMVWLLHWLLYA